MTMRAVCAWCQADLGERPGPEGKVTHGICPPCAAAERARIRRAVAGIFGGPPKAPKREGRRP